MLNKKSVTLVGCVLAVALVSACSGDKVLPKGTRVSVLAPVSAIKPDVALSVGRIKVPSAEINSAWTQVGYNAQHLQKNFKGSTNFVEQWSADFGKGESKREFLISKPLSNGDMVYTLDASGIISAFNIKDGKEVWSLKLQAKNENVDDMALRGAGIAFENDVIFATTGYGDVYAVNAKTQKILWRQSLNTPIRIAPTVAGGNVYVLSVDNRFFALSNKTGEIQWEYDISLENTTLVGGAPVAYAPSGNMAIVGFSSGELQAFNASLGSPLWSDVLISNRQAYSSTFLNTIKAAPVVEYNTVYALGNGNMLTAIDLQTGRRSWEKEIGGVDTPLLVGNTLYLVSNTNDLVAVDKTNGDILWASAIDMGKKPANTLIYSPVMVDGQLVVALSSGMVYLYAPQTGKLIKNVDLDEKLNSAPIVANGYVFFVTSSAELIAYK